MGYQICDNKPTNDLWKWQKTSGVMSDFFTKICDIKWLRRTKGGEVFQVQNKCKVGDDICTSCRYVHKSINRKCIKTVLVNIYLHRYKKLADGVSHLYVTSQRIFLYVNNKKCLP